MLLLLFPLLASGAPSSGPCCSSKTVGGLEYTLVREDSAALSLSCLSPCVYERSGMPGLDGGPQYCFARGEQTVFCGNATSGVAGQPSSPPAGSNSSCECAAVASGSRIVGGSEVNPKYKLPYQALISPCSADGNCFLCGGTIVNKRYIVTAAHCLYSSPTANSKMTIAGGSKYRVMVGEHNKCEFDDGVNQFLLASVVHEHPDFKIDAPDVNNDIAVLKMAQDLPFSDKVAPACLPTDAAKDYSGKASTISGWGGTKANSVDNPVVQPDQCALKEGIVEVLATSNSKCSDFLGVSASTTQLCAWADGIDACQGDSGGPLTVAEDGKYVLLGVTSFGTGCATATPGVYTRVQGYLPWINNIIADGKCG